MPEGHKEIHINRNEYGMAVYCTVIQNLYNLKSGLVLGHDALQ